MQSLHPYACYRDPCYTKPFRSLQVKILQPLQIIKKEICSSGWGSLLARPVAWPLIDISRNLSPHVQTLKKFLKI